MIFSLSWLKLVLFPFRKMRNLGDLKCHLSWLVNTKVSIQICWLIWQVSFLPQERSFILSVCIAWVLTKCQVIGIQNQTSALNELQSTWGYRWVWWENILCHPATAQSFINSGKAWDPEIEKIRVTFGLLSSKGLAFRRDKWHSDVQIP